MRLVTWNMSHWQKTESQRTAAWAALRALEPDVALLQEAVPPAGVENVVYRAIGDGRAWGSAVVGFTTPLEEMTHANGRYNKQPVSLQCTIPGSVAIARASFDRREITFVSMYGVIDDGYADTTVHRQLSDLVPLLDQPKTEIVLGGDLNITTQWIGKEARYRDWELATFARIRAFGLVDVMDLKRPDGPLQGCGCADGEQCRHVHTQRHSQSHRPWQNDYVFASRRLAMPERLVRAEVVDDPALHELSGHMPLLVEIDLT